MAPNNYKRDEGKAPLLAALQPFAPALYALARMMEDMQHKHRLAGSSDPFNQWAQLPEAKQRMTQAMERHLLPEDCTLWDVNHKDGKHLHATHGLFNLLGALTLHLRGQAAAAPLDALRDKAATPDFAHVLERAKAEMQASCPHGSLGGPGKCSCFSEARAAMHAAHAIAARGLHVPAGADWRESAGSDQVRVARSVEPPVQWWTDDRGTWRCWCGAGSEQSCTCPRVGENL